MKLTTHPSSGEIINKCNGVSIPPLCSFYEELKETFYVMREEYIRRGTTLF